MKKLLRNQKLRLMVGFVVTAFLFISKFVTAQAFTVPAGGTTGSISPIDIKVNGLTIGKGANTILTNTAIGIDVLANATLSGNYNTGLGHSALKNNTTGIHNIAVGFSAIGGSNTGSFNACIGSEAMLANTSGANNVAVGRSSMYLNTSGKQNVSIGSSSLRSNSVGDNNCAIGHGALYNLNTTFSANASGNVALGYYSLASLSEGYDNVTIGINAASGLNVGYSNVAIGGGVSMSSGNYQLNIQNCIYGSNMGNGSSGGIFGGNVSIGNLPVSVIGGVYPSTTPKLNIAGTLRIGTVTLNNVSAGLTEYLYVDANNMVAKATLPTTVPNIATSTCTLLNTIPKVNAAGSNALVCSQITDNGATVAIGTATGFTYTSGGAQFGSTGVTIPPTLAGGTVFRLVVGGWISGLGMIATSDKRLKKDIKKIDGSLEKISKINGYTYNWNKDFVKEKQLDDNRQAGFLAQEVEKVLPEAVAINSDGIYGLNYNAIMPLLTEGIKEQQKQIEAQQLEIENLKLQITELKNKFNQLIPGDVKIKVNSLEVIPNPITGTSVVSYKLDNANAQSVLVISDLQGKLLKQISLPKNQQQGQVQVSKKDLPNGMYVFAIVSGNAEVQSKKVLVSE